MTIEKLTTDDWKTVFAISDTFVPPVKPQALKNHFSAKDVSIDQIAELCPSTSPGYQQTLHQTLSQTPRQILANFLLVIKILGTSSTSWFLTGKCTIFRELSQKDRENVLQSWQFSKLQLKRQLFRSLRQLALSSYIRISPLVYKCLSHPEFERKSFDFKHMYTFQMLDLTNISSFEVFVDVIIAGSGSSAGVVASRLSRQGLKVLVIEKGKCYHQSELQFNEDKSYDLLYENHGNVTTADANMTILSASTFGGGSTINWSASLRSPPEVRKEWVQNGVPWFGEKIFDEALDFVLTSMGCSTKYITHSYSNQLILDGCKKLGYEFSEIPQNWIPSP